MSNIVITGVSAVTPIGNTIEEITKSLKEGKSGIDYITKYNASDFLVKHAGEVNKNKIKQSKTLYENTTLQFFQHCLSELFQNLDTEYRKDRMGCFIGTDPNIAIPNDYGLMIDQYLNQHPNQSGKDLMQNINPMKLLYYASKHFQIHGPSMCNLGTCSASAQSLGTAYKMLKNKQVDIAIAGGVSSKIDPFTVTRLSRLDALEETKEKLKDNCKPFDMERKGFTISEGCVLFILEREEDALERNATILATLKGYGAALDGFSITDPHQDAFGMSLSMKRAIADANLGLQEIDYINAHGTGTPKNDKYETMAIKKVFKEYAYSLDISSTKSMHGHLMTAAGAMEVLVGIIAIKNSFIPPTINYNTLDEDCDLSYTPNRAKEKKVINVLSNSFGLGGQNASLIISKYGV